MPELSSEQRALYRSRLQNFERFVGGVPGALAELAELFSAAPEDVVRRPQDYLQQAQDLAQSCRQQAFPEEDARWVFSRLVYYVGELLKHRHHGQWTINENPHSPFFLRYVIGGFAEHDPEINVDPATIVKDLFDRDDCDLFAVIREVDAKLDTNKPGAGDS
jgi:hypothetical protein